MIPTTKLRQKRRCLWGKRVKLDRDSRIMFPTDHEKDSDFFLKNRGMMVLGDNLDLVEQGGMGIMIDHNGTQEFLNLQDFRNLHKLFLGVLHVNVAHVTRLKLTAKR